MNQKQSVATLLGIIAACGVYYVKFIGPIAKLKRDHPEIIKTNPPNAIVSGSGTLMLLIVVLLTAWAIIALRGRN